MKFLVRQKVDLEKNSSDFVQKDSFQKSKPACWQ